MTIAGLLALAGVSGLAGGFEEAEPEGVIRAAAPLGPQDPTKLKVAPLDVVIRRTYVQDHQRFFEVQVKNSAVRPMYWGDFQGMFTLKDSSRPDDDQVQFVEKYFRLAPGEPLPKYEVGEMVVLNPGVPYDLTIVYTDPIDGSAPGSAEAADVWLLESQEYKASILDGDIQWLPGSVAAEVSLR